MELYVLRLPVIPIDLFFFIVTAYCASLLPCSVCFDAQYEICQNTSTCGSLIITYPFGSGNQGCGLPNFQIDCVQNSSPVITIHGLNYTILTFHYDQDYFAIAKDDNCQFLGESLNIGSEYADAFFNLTDTPNWTVNLYNCNTTFPGGGKLDKCNASVYYSLIDSGNSTGCRMKQITIQVGIVEWATNDTKRDEDCSSCETSGGICGYSSSDATAARPFVCYCKDGPRNDNCRHGMNIGVAVGCSVGAAVLIAVGLVVGITLYVKRRKPPKPPPRSSISKVEKFLKEYADETPTRYSLSDLDNITNNFAEKVGEGGFGVVYKGKLPNGALVAVKLLDRHRRGESTQFMNEVATIGQTRHVNLVRLLGYCFESFTSALIYEFMINGSLEKFIFARKEKEKVLSWEQLYSIALGVARGIAYLHHDCEKRIIHFDIKPHNILLDADFTPKVCDFGLAKLCGKEDDHISMTAVRGTPGYVAPELCDRDLGPVTDKSDVYSFGMLLLEIVGERKNFNRKVSRSSQFYFPEWAFKLLENGELGMRLRAGELEAEDEEKARRLTKVGLWCIQYDYRDRPGMSRVIQMLEGNEDDIGNPPMPSNSSSDYFPLIHGW